MDATKSILILWVTFKCYRVEIYVRNGIAALWFRLLCSKLRSSIEALFNLKSLGIGPSVKIPNYITNFYVTFVIHCFQTSWNELLQHSCFQNKTMAKLEEGQRLEAWREASQRTGPTSAKEERGKIRCT